MSVPMVSAWRSTALEVTSRPASSCSCAWPSSKLTLLPTTPSCGAHQVSTPCPPHPTPDHVSSAFDDKPHRDSRPDQRLQAPTWSATVYGGTRDNALPGRRGKYPSGREGRAGHKSRCTVAAPARCIASRTSISMGSNSIRPVLCQLWKTTWSTRFTSCGTSRWTVMLSPRLLERASRILAAGALQAQNLSLPRWRPCSHYGCADERQERLPRGQTRRPARRLEEARPSAYLLQW